MERENKKSATEDAEKKHFGKAKRQGAGIESTSNAREKNKERRENKRERETSKMKEKNNEKK